LLQSCLMKSFLRCFNSSVLILICFFLQEFWRPSRISQTRMVVGLQALGTKLNYYIKATLLQIITGS
jgi:hypothetical protein